MHIKWKGHRINTSPIVLSEFGISNASARCIGYQEAVEVYKSSQLVIVSLRVCSGPNRHDSFRRVINLGRLSTLPLSFALKHVTSIII